MNILNELYNKSFKKILIHPRKKRITAKKVILKGPRKSGKSYLIYDHINNYLDEEFLYIDFQDLRVDKRDIELNLEDFIEKNPIKLLVLENFDFSFDLPNIQELIITTTKDLTLKGFTNQYLYPLDFEEFISFDNRHNNTEQIFNYYANIGTFPNIVLESKEYIKNIQELLQLIFKNQLEFDIYKEFAVNQNKKVSLFSIFNILKNSHKISKDKFYEYTKKLQDEKLLFLMEKYNHPKATKKVFLIDFAIKNALTFDKQFINRFENMIFLELIKRDYEVYYTDMLNFYIPKYDSVVLPMPFVSVEMILSKLKRLQNYLHERGIKRVDILTFETKESFERDGIVFEILSFWDWAVQIGE